MAAVDARAAVGDLVHGPAVVVEPRTDLAQVAHILGDLGIGMVVVMEGGSVAGVVSERDIVWAIARDVNLEDVWAADIMTEEVVTVAPSVTVRDAAALMAQRNARHIVVLHGDRPGVVSVRDVLEYLAT